MGAIALFSWAWDRYELVTSFLPAEPESNLRKLVAILTTKTQTQPKNDVHLMEQLWEERKRFLMPSLRSGSSHS